MSAFVVAREHIDLLVDAAISGMRGVPVQPGYRQTVRWRDSEARRENATAIGQMLTDENVRSIHYRYPDTVDAYSAPGSNDWQGGYTFRRHAFSLSPVEVLAAIACYRYQACEHPESAESEAFAFCDALEQAAIRSLPGYDDAPWEWSSDTIRTAAAAGAR